MYAVFAFLCVWGYRRQYINNGQGYRKKALLLAAIISIAYGGMTEIMQEYLVPGRIGDRFDFLADCIGAFLGVTFFAIFYRHKK